MTFRSDKKTKLPSSVSRLDLVRKGKTENQPPKIAPRGRILVDIEQIIPDPANERKAFRNIEGLAETIKRTGLIEPPTVVVLDNGKYMLTTGERRWRASKIAGKKQIPVIVSSREEENKRRLKSLISNIQREDLDGVELAQALKSMKDDRFDVKTNRDLSKLIGKSEQWVGHMLKILSLPKDLQEKASSSEKTIPADSLQHIARLNNERQQRALFDEALQGASVKTIREMVKAAQKKKQIKKKRSISKYTLKYSENGNISALWKFPHSCNKNERIAAINEICADAIAIESAKKSIELLTSIVFRNSIFINHLQLRSLNILCLNTDTCARTRTKVLEICYVFHTLCTCGAYKFKK